MLVPKGYEKFTVYFHSSGRSRRTAARLIISFSIILLFSLYTGWKVNGSQQVIISPRRLVLVLQRSSVILSIRTVFSLQSWLFSCSIVLPAVTCDCAVEKSLSPVDNSIVINTHYWQAGHSWSLVFQNQHFMECLLD